MTKPVRCLQTYSPYGAADIRATLGAHLFEGAASSILLWVLVFFLILGMTRLLPTTHFENPTIPKIWIDVLQPPPPIGAVLPLKAAPFAPSRAMKPDALPNPAPAPAVPDIPTAAHELGDIAGPAGEANGSANTAPPAGEGETVLPPHGTFIYAEELPVLIKQVDPVYSELALEARVEGTVLIDVLVDRLGKVRETAIRSSVLLLDDSARRAVLQWVFTPALSNGRPVAVWVAVRVIFRIQ